jgi:predicted tellurium resistance membrane protein TerC
LLTVESAGAADVPAAAGVLGAVPTIAIADIVMSPDNVLAVAAAAQGAWGPIVVGLLVSMPLVAACATLILALLARLPVLVWAGAGLIGWIAGELLLADPAIRPAVETLARSHGTTTGTVEIAAAGLGALLVVAAGRVLQRRRS